MTLKKVGIKLMTILSFLLLSFSLVYATGFSSLSNCLITNDIGIFSYEANTARLGSACGVVGGADHFKLDHVDSICNGEYSNINEVKNLQTRGEIVNKLLSIDVQVTQHAGADSDKWLLHELEENYRDDETERLGLLTDGAVMRKIDNNRVLWLGIGGGTFRWVRNNIVISISYTDLQGTKAEPIEVVKAYLAKFPSTITLTDAELKDSPHNVQWIKDEMERRLWLCDKWSMQLQLGKVTQAEMLQALVKHMTIFLNYRQKYLSQYVEKEKTADKEITALSTYLTANDGTSIKAKLTEYKTWWTANKSKSISL